MGAMGGMPMPGGWTMSMIWVRMPGQTWPGMAASFLAMWVVMMAAMMLPSLVPMLSRYRRSVGRVAGARVGILTVLVAAGYFAVWAASGLIVFPLGAALAAVELQRPALARAVPLVAGVLMLIAGCVQLSAWKARQLACCRHTTCCSLSPHAHTAWRHGLRLGLDCIRCCAGWMVILLAVGVMDLGPMAGVAVAISVERLAPAGERAARVLGVVVVAAGTVLVARAVGMV